MTKLKTVSDSLISQLAQIAFEEGFNDGGRTAVPPHNDGKAVLSRIGVTHETECEPYHEAAFLSIYLAGFTLGKEHKT